MKPVKNVWNKIHHKKKTNKKSYFAYKYMKNIE